MIVYFAPGPGRDLAIRAAAISRRLTQPVTAVVFPGQSQPLALAGVSYVEADGIEATTQAARELNPDLIVFDACDDFNQLDFPSVYVTRADRCLPTEGRHLWSFGAEQPLPWALPEEILNRAQARAILGARTGLPLVVSFPPPGMLDVYGAIVNAEGIAESITAPDIPASTYLAGVDLVYAEPDSSLYWEGPHAVWWTTLDSPNDQRTRVPNATRPTLRRVKAGLKHPRPTWTPPPQGPVEAIAARLDALGSPHG